MVFVFLFIITLYNRESFTPAEEIVIEKKIKHLEHEFKSLNNQFQDQQKQMKEASDQAALAKASISAAKV